MLNLSAETIENSLSPAEIIEAVKTGIIKCESGVYKVPTRMHLEGEGITNLVMPAMGKRYFCTKLVSVVPSNPQRDLPMILGTVVLSKMETGETLALMDAPMITALRTAAVGALGLDLIALKETETIGIIGLGVQGIWQTIFACTVRPIKQVYCYSRTKAKFDFFKKKILEKYPQISIYWCESSEELVQKSQVIYTCTTSAKPVFSGTKDLIQNKRFISVGSFRKDMQELPNSVYEETDVLILDSEAAKEEVGDVINALRNGFLTENQVFTIGKIFAEERRIEHSQNVVFKSVGMAAFDLALAAAVYEKFIFR